MKKYIRGVICIAYSFIKFCLIKVFHFEGFTFSVFNLVSPFTQVEIGNKSKLVLGKMVRIRSGSKIRIRNYAEMQIGSNTSLNHGCIFTVHERVLIGNDVQFGPNVLIYDHDHDFKKKDGLKNLNYKTSPIEIGENTWIGANVVILRGSKIGKNCVVAAGSIVSKGEYPDNSLIYQKKDTKVVEIKYIG